MQIFFKYEYLWFRSDITLPGGSALWMWCDGLDDDGYIIVTLLDDWSNLWNNAQHDE
jgi:hypothetical protein